MVWADSSLLMFWDKVSQLRSQAGGIVGCFERLEISHSISQSNTPEDRMHLKDAIMLD